MSHPICVTCGVQYEAQPDECKICADERQYVGWDGQQWTTATAIEQSGSRNRIEEIERGLWGIGTDPWFGIGQRALLVVTDHGNVLWDCISYLDVDTIRRINDLGGIQAISMSHPHFYGSVVDWSRAFDGAPIYLPDADREWICRDDPAYRFYADSVEPVPGMTIQRCGGHFEGSAVLHWEGSSEGRGALLTGDTIQVVMDRAAASFMRSYPNLIPLDPEAIRGILRAIEPYPFDRVYGGWWRRNIASNGRAALEASAARYIERIEGRA